MTSDREIITIQVGTASNFVGTHWWNIQESSFVFDRKKAEADETRLKHDVLFREGKNLLNKTTCTPRLVVVDFSDRVGRTNLSGKLYPQFASSPKFSDGIGPATSIAIAQPSKPSNQFLSDLEIEEKSLEDQGRVDIGARVESKYYDLDNVVSAWTDYLRLPLHPKSLLTCDVLNDNGLMSRFEDGENLCKSGQFLDDFENRLRFFAEDANCLQGFHYLCDIHDGMAGISSELVQYIRDEYPRSAIMTSAIFPNELNVQDPREYDQYIWNTANGLSSLGSHSTIVVPLSTAGKLWKWPADQRRFNYLNYKATLPYHTSGVLATALETCTTPWRRLTNYDHLGNVCDTMAFDGRKFALLSTALPLGISETTSVQDYFKTASQQMDDAVVSLTPYVTGAVNDDAVLQKCPKMVSFSMRGVKGLSKGTVLDQRSFDAQCRSVSELLYERYKADATSVSVNSIYEPVHTKAPFPHIFENRIGRNGLPTGVLRSNAQGVNSVPTLTFLESSSRMADFLKAINFEVGHLNWHKLKVEKDIADQVTNRLIDFTQPFLNQNNSFC